MNVEAQAKRFAHYPETYVPMTRRTPNYWQRRGLPLVSVEDSRNILMLPLVLFWPQKEQGGQNG
jgi:hypothetical protein